MLTAEHRARCKERFRGVLYGLFFSLTSLCALRESILGVFDNLGEADATAPTLANGALGGAANVGVD